MSLVVLKSSVYYSPLPGDHIKTAIGHTVAEGYAGLVFNGLAIATDKEGCEDAMMNAYQDRCQAKSRLKRHIASDVFMRIESEILKLRQAWMGER